MCIRDRGDKVAFVGKNGEGKSTLVKCIMGEITDFTGKLQLGHNVKIGYFAQNQAQLLNENLTVFDTIDYVAQGDIRLKIRDILGAFMFGGEASDKKVKVLSGGERTRLAMIRLLLEPVNLLILDEPTNHLDMRSKDVLKDALREFDGTVIVVSHDRYFMDKVVDHLLVFRGNADIKDFPGNYTQYRDWKDVQDQLEKEAEAALQARQNPAPEKPSRPVNEQKKKLTFKERKEFEALEEEIPALEAEKAELETAMSSGTLSTDELMAKSQRITQVMEEIDEKTMRWLELSELA